MKQSRKYHLFSVLLITVFSIYNFNIYTSKSDYGSIHLSKKAIKGESLWLRNNCNGCHQIYGLGGYLGPDLTNVYSTKRKDEKYLKAMINSGIKTMPKFNFNENEKKELVQFLKEINETGYYPNANSAIENDGWVRIKYKNENYEK